MSFVAQLRRARDVLRQEGRLSLRGLARELEIDGAPLDEIIEELVDVQQVARRQGPALVWVGGQPGAPSPPEAAAVAEPAAPGGDARKIVTVVFADLAGSTALHERLDAESTRQLMDRYYRALRGVVQAHGGTIVKLLGDGVMAAFGVPRVAEDDAIRAVRAGIAMQQAFRGLVREQAGLATDIGLRVGVNTGEVVVGADNDDVVGDPVNVAARLQREAHDGEVVIGEATRRLVSELVTLAPLGAIAIKGRAETVAAYRVVSLDRPAGAAAVAFVGRDDELRRLTAVYEAAVSAPAACLAVVLGSPGLGKSRLLDEVGRRLGDGATVLSARCESAGAATFAPIAKAVRAFLRIEEAASVAAGPGGEIGTTVAVRSPGNQFPGSVDQSRLKPTGQSSGESPSGDFVATQPGDLFLGVGPPGPVDDTLRTAITVTLPADTPDRERIAGGIAALLAGTPASPEETFYVVRRFLSALATRRPVILAIDDLQWAEPLLLDLVEHLVQWGKGIPLLVLAGARPELRDTRSSLATSGGLVSDVIMLAGLDAAAATRLAANVIGAEALPAAVAGRVLATSEGNPLFLGELVRMLVNDGALKREGDRWTTAVDLAALEMPPTIHALLAARIERLRPEDRLVLERAAVIGRQFSRGAVAQLLPREITDLDARLEALRRSETIEPDTGWFLGEPALRFHHGLTRDAAYRRVLKGTRAELHARVADWIESKVAGAIEHDEAIGWHLEQAHQHLRELGPLDAQGRAFGERAARYLAAAGRRALARDDLSPAASLLGRALHLLDEADPTRADLALDWCEALLSAAEVGLATKAIDELGRWIGEPPSAPSPTHPLSVGEGRGEGASAGGTSAAPSPFGTLTLPVLNRRAGEDSVRLRAWHTCFVGQLAILTDPQALRTTVDAVAAAAAALTAAGDAAGEAKAHQVHALALQRLGAIGACEAALDKALAAARRVDNRRRSNAVLAGAPQAALWGPSPVNRASGRCLDVVRVLRITQGAPAVEAVALRCQAVLEALRGRTDAARRMIASARRMVEELGITQQVLETDLYIGLIEWLEQDVVTAERSLRTAYEGFRAHGLGIDAARAASLLGRALLAQGNVADAEALSHESEALAGDDLQAAIAWRRVRVEALAARGDHTAAIAVARTAVDIAGATDALLLHADARMALASALRAAGQPAEAAAEEARAIELWDSKGATLLAERARRAARKPLPRPLSDTERGALPPSLAGKGARGLGSVRRVRPNAATAHTARLDAVVAARNADALPTLFADKMEAIDHTTHADWDRHAVVSSWRSLLLAQGSTCQYEPLATLGDRLALCRMTASASRLARGSFDVGGYEKRELHLIEVDAQGRRRWTEVFAIDHLGDAVARLYERYAELLPDGLSAGGFGPQAGPEQRRAVATARSVATLLRPPDRWPFAPDVEARDHRTVGFGSLRGADAVLRAVVTLRQLSDDIDDRFDDVLDLRSDALLVRWTNSGTDRASGGAFERCLCELWVFGADGLLTRWEQFDAEQDTEALARFAELNASVSPLAKGRTKEGSLPARRVRPNSAIANAARVDAAVAARDADAFPTLLTDDVRIVHHPTGAAYDRQGVLFSLHSMLRAHDLTYRHDPLATLGDSLALCRLSVSASGATPGRFDVGAYESENIVLTEVDARGQRRLIEIFAANRLGDAVARLYERYAELLPEGPEREGAAETARSVAALQGPSDRWRDRGAPFAPDVEARDHRTVGFGSLRGADAVLRAVVTLRQLSDDIDDRFDDVLDLRSDALLVRSTTSGTIRATGGAFEQDLCQLFVFEANGLLTRWEQFDAQQDAEALARFDELNPSVSPLAKGRTKEGSLPARRVRPNAATSSVERLDAAIATRDAAPLPTLLSDEYELVDHTTGVAYDREGALFSLRALQSAQDPTSRHEPLATLGDSLVLCRWSTSASGFAGGTFDVGAYEREQIDLTEVDAQGRRRRAELFAADRLGDAIVRLYERYAELLPVGPARTRAAATARSVAATVGPFFDPERGAAAWAPAIAVADHRPLATMSGRGAEALLQNLRAWQDLADNLAVRDEDVLGLQPDALLLRRLFFGTDRAGGGVFERHFLSLLVFGTDGLMTGSEYFEADRDAEALARFDELARDSGERRTVTTTARIDNTVTRSLDRMAEAWNAGDWDRVAAFYTSDFRLIDHRTLIHLEVDRDQYLQGVRLTWDMRASRLTSEVFATRGDRLALLRTRHEVTDVDVGPSEREYLGITEVDDRGNHVAMVLFDAGNVDAAYAELDERYAAGEAAPYAATWEAYLRNVRAIAAQDWEQLAAGYAPDCVLEDHRPLGLPTMRSRDECVASIRAFVELRPDARSRTPHVLALRDRWSLTVTGWIGSESEGAFEIPVVAVTGYDRDGHTERVDLYNLDQLDEALARYEALGAAAAKPLRIENAATRWFDRFGAAWEARDWDRVAACFAVGFRLIDRQKMARVECDRNQQLKILRWTFGRTSRWAWETLATRGERLALVGEHLEHTGRAFGPTELEGLVVAEVNDAGEYERAVVFDPDDLDAAYAELDERYAAGEAAPFAVVTTGARAFAAAVAARDWDALAAVLAPDLVVYDHRPLGWETLRGAAMLVDTWKSLLELAADAHLRIDHVTATANGSLALLALLGTHEGGEFEDVRVVVHEYDGNGKICRHDIYNPDQLAEAWARYEAIGTRGSGVREEPFTPSSGQLAKPMSLDTAPKAGVYSGRTEMPGPRIEGDPLRIPPNAACRARARVTEVYAAGDWDALRALASDAFVFEDREKHALLTGDVEMWIGSLKFRAGLRFAFDELIATAGDRIALQRVVMTGEPEGAAVEVEFLLLTEVDAAGRLVAVILFDPEDRRAASTELLERHARSEAGRSMPAAVFEGFRAINAHDLDRFRATLHDDFVFDDHRRTGVGRIQGADDYVASIRPLFEGAPDFFTDNLYYVAIEPHGTLAIARTFGTLAEGGEFESVFVRLVVFRDDRFARIEQFEVEDLNRARARFEVLA